MNCRLVVIFGIVQPPKKKKEFMLTTIQAFNNFRFMVELLISPVSAIPSNNGAAMVGLGSDLNHFQSDNMTTAGPDYSCCGG